jgi:hypothetical protein
LLGLLSNPKDGGSTFPQNSVNFYETTQHNIPQFLRTNERETRRDQKITIFWDVTSCSMVKVYYVLNEHAVIFL